MTQAETVEDLYDNIDEVLHLYLEEPQDSEFLAPLPDPSIKTSRSVIEVSVKPEIAFAFMVRYYRLKHGLTQQEAEDRMGL